MRTFTLLKGLPVYAKNTGENLGQVFDLCLSKSGELKGLLLKRGALVKRTYLIDVKDVSSFGADGVMVENDSILQTAKDSIYPIFEGKGKLVGKPLMSSEGDHLGLLEDVYFHEELGTIVGYECSDGFFADITEGKRIVKTDEPLQIGKDAIIVNLKP